MSATLSVHEAKTNFSSVLAAVERDAVTLTIMRYGRPVARIVPIKRNKRSLKPMSGVAGKIKVKCDLFADSSEDWEACNAVVPA